MKSYESFEEWLKDFSIFKKNPDDLKFYRAIQTRTNNSSIDIRNQVEVFLEGLVMDENPLEIFRRVMASIPKDYWLVIKSPEQPWFEV